MRAFKITASITNRDALSVEKYLQSISKEPMITADEEIILAKSIKNGDQSALEKLVKANLRFVVSVAKQYQNQGLPLGDLINEGNLGLMKAAERFDETRGFKFISYAVWWIRQSILQSLADQSRLISLPLNKVSLGSKVRRAQQDLEQDFEREATAEEIAEFMDISVSDVRSVLADQFLNVVSLDHSIYENEEGIMDIIPDENAVQADRHLVHDESLHKELMKYVSRLNKQQQDIIISFFGIGLPFPKTLDQIGSDLNLTRERVRQIKDKAIKRLTLIAKDGLKNYL